MKREPFTKRTFRHERTAVVPFESNLNVSRSSTMLLALFVISSKKNCSIGWYTYLGAQEGTGVERESDRGLGDERGLPLKVLT